MHPYHFYIYIMPAQPLHHSQQQLNAWISYGVWEIEDSALISGEQWSKEAGGWQGY